MDKKIFAKGMFILLTAYEKEMSQDTQDVYFSFLGHLTPAQLEKAARHHIAKSSWFPKINELLDAVNADRPSAIDVWNRLMEAAPTGRQPELDDAADQALRHIGGWFTFQTMPTEEIRFRFKDFKVAYMEAINREVVTQPAQVSSQTVPQLEKK